MPFTDTLTNVLQTWGELNFSGVAVLAFAFLACALLPIPRTPLLLASGAVFGVPGLTVILPSNTLGAVLGLLLARFLFADAFYRMIGRRPRWRVVLDAIGDEGWRVVGLVSFGCPIPTFAQNYMFGLTRIGLWPFAAATFLFTIPQICLYVYLGALGKQFLIARRMSPLSLGLAGVAALTVAAIIFLIARRARTALQRLPA